jgi:hypothetical protein
MDTTATPAKHTKGTAVKTMVSTRGQLPIPHTGAITLPTPSARWTGSDGVRLTIRLSWATLNSVVRQINTPAATTMAMPTTALARRTTV